MARIFAGTVDQVLHLREGQLKLLFILAWSKSKIFPKNSCVIINAVKSYQPRYIRDGIIPAAQIFLTFENPVICQILKGRTGESTLKKPAAL